MPPITTLLRKPAAGGRIPFLAVALAATVVLAAGLWIGFHYSLGLWGPDPDALVPLATWEGVRRHGLAFLPSWYYSPDNWLLSLIPLDALLFQVFGDSPTLVAGVGWLIFVASVGLTAWLAGRLAGWRAGLALACVLVFANAQALGEAGYLAAPVSHNISAAWALLALILAHRGVARADTAASLAAALCVFVGALSDPWAVAAIGAPLLLASGGVAALHWRTPAGRRAALICGATLLALAAAQTRLFGLLPFLSRNQFALAPPSAMGLNLYWAYRALAAMFNIAPHLDPDRSAVARIVSVLVLGAVVGAAGLLVAAGLRRAAPARQLVLGAALLSIAGVGAAFLVGRWPLGLNLGRFFPNLYFLGGLLVAVAAAERWSRWRWPPKAALATLALLFMAAGVASRPALWTGAQPPRNAEATRALGAFLAGRGLSYGYGPYWGSQALVMDWVTGGRVTIRPVSFMNGPIERRRAETSSFWYLPADEPANDPRRFLIVMNDGEECPDLDRCVALAVTQFGPPSERLAYGSAIVLVWPHPISAQIHTAG